MLWLDPLIAALGAGTAVALAARELLLRGTPPFQFQWGRARRRRHERAFVRQLPHILTHLSSALKAGLTLTQACEIAANELPPPAADEFGIVVAQVRAGMTTEAAFLGLAERIPLDDVSITAQAVAVLAASGGNIIEAFEKIARTIEERRRIADKVQALTTQGVVQGAILVALPFVLGLILWIVSPAYLAPLFSSALGWSVVALVVILEVLGAWLIRRLVTIEV